MTAVFRAVVDRTRTATVRFRRRSQHGPVWRIESMTGLPTVFVPVVAV